MDEPQRMAGLENMTKDEFIETMRSQRARWEALLGQMSIEQIKLRTATQADAEFIFQMIKTTMQEYVAQLWGWDEQWQRAYFQERFDPSKDQVIVLEGKDIGVISVEEKENELFLSKIYILPDYQGQGIGTYLIRSVLDRAACSGLPVALRVLTANPAKRLYERLGFVEVERTDTHILMQKKAK